MSLISSKANVCSTTMKKTTDKNSIKDHELISNHGKKYDDEALEDKIKKSLTDMYDNVLNEPIPDELLAILRDDE